MVVSSGVLRTAPHGRTSGASGGNMRDHASLHEPHILANLEVLNAELIKLGLSSDDRKSQLEQAAQRHAGIIKDAKLPD